MDKKNKNLIYSLSLTVVFLVGLAAIFSYGYIGYKANISNNDVLNGNVLNPENIFSISGNTDFNLNITLENLNVTSADNNMTNYIDDTKNVTINVSVSPEQYKKAITCEYKIYYQPTTEYKASAASTGKTELGISGEISNTSTKFDAKSIGNVSSKTELYSGNITTNQTTGTASQEWSLHYRFYNLDVDQSDVIGKSASGKIIIEGQNCYASKN